MAVPVPELRSVFVYGTLMPDERNAHVAGKGFTAQAARLPGFRLFHLMPEGYPGVVRGEGEVSGFVLTYSLEAWAQALPFLDHLEGVDETPPLYCRERVGVRLESDGEAESWVYIYARPERLEQAGVTEVAGGDWCTVAGRQERGPDER
ncbi:gamma-glutamylcyclotransferase family protein [Deinococcus sp. VB343]|uniref:Putative gamma-glutamylcyclotransferase n=1 Tax=Deinococcus sp. VB142 TaxID=3112952 RepID=A0AAU6Q655_9DEIO